MKRRTGEHQRNALSGVRRAYFDAKLLMDFGRSSKPHPSTCAMNTYMGKRWQKPWARLGNSPH